MGEGRASIHTVCTEMGATTKPRFSWAHRTGVLIVVLSLALSAFSASAASLGGIDSDELFAFSDPASVPVPSVIVEDSFTGCNGALNGWTTLQGQVWSNHWGGWQCLAGGMVRAQFRLPLAHASVDAGVSDDVVITATFDRVSTQNGRSGPGIALFTDGFFHMYAIVELDQNRVTLGKWSPWANVVVTSVPISVSSVDDITVVIDQPGLTVLVNSVPHITFDLSTLPANEQAQFLTKTRFGLEADADNWSRFDSFRIETLP